MLSYFSIDATRQQEVGVIKFIMGLMPFFDPNRKRGVAVSVKRGDQIICSYEGLNLLYQVDEFLAQLSNVVGLPSKHFEVLYEIPIRLMCCRLQHIPSRHSGSSNIFLTQKLGHILKGMKYRENYIMPTGVAPEDINQKRDLWRYATFFALVLVEIGPTLTSHMINIKNHSSNFSTRWNPFGNTAPIGSTVEYKLIDAVDDLSSLVLAPLLFSPSSIEWLRQDKDAFNLSLSAIFTQTGDQIIAKIVNYALSENNQIHDICTHKPVKNPATKKTKNAPSKNPISAREQGNQFLKWLTTGYQEGADYIQVLTIKTVDGLAFKTPETFKVFVDKSDVDWKTVSNGFKKLNVHKMSERSDIFNIPDPSGKIYRCHVINANTLDLPEPPSFLEWLRNSIKNNTIAGTKSRPLSFSANGYLYLVHPDIFIEYARQLNFNIDLAAIEHEFLSLNIHTKGVDSHSHEFPINGGESLTTLKLPLNVL